MPRRAGHSPVTLRAVAPFAGAGVALAALAMPLLIAGEPRAEPRADPQAERKPPAGGRGAPRDGSRDEERVEGFGPARSWFDGPEAAAALLLEDAHRERAEPLLVARPDGGAWLVCVEHESAAGDRLVARELAPDGTLQRATGAAPPAWPPPGQPPIALVRPVGALDAAGVLTLVFTELTALGPQLRATRLLGSAFEPARALTTDAVPSRNPELARAADGTLWLAFERFGAATGAGARGSYDVVVAPLREAGLGEAIVVGDSPGSELDPVLVADGAALAVAWSRYGGRDYEIVARRVDPASGALGPLLELSADGASDDLHPTLASAADGTLWCAWDRIEDAARGRSSPAEFDAERGFATPRPPPRASVRLAVIAGDEVRVPDGGGEVAGVPLLSLAGALPRLVAHESGGLSLLLRYLGRKGPGGRAYGYPLLATSLSGEGFAPFVQLAGSAGLAEEAAACAVPGGLFVAWQQDHRLECETGTLLRPLPAELQQRAAQKHVALTGYTGPSAVGVARLPAPDPARGVARAAAPRPDRREPRHAHPAAASLDDPFVTGAAHFEIRAGERAWRVWWGDLHRHSNVSRCSRGFEPGPGERYAFGRDVALLDFMALTDHSCHVDPFAWWRLDEAAQLAGHPGFVVLAGFEWSTGFFGHQNVILRGGLRPFLSNTWPACRDLKGLYSLLRPEWALAIPHHPADVARRTDYAQCDPRLVRLVEIYQAQRGSYEFDGCVRQSHLAHAPGCFATDAIAKGLKPGFIASTDHGEGAAYACVLAESLEREALFDALRARRCYGATAKGMVVDLRVDGRVMGEELATGGAPRVTLAARGAQELAEVVVFRDGVPWQVIGRDGEDASRARATIVTLQLELVPPAAARALDWQLAVAPAAGAGLRMRPWFELPGYARDDLGPDRPEWTVDGGAASYLWKGSYAGFWEPSHSRLRIEGRGDARLVVRARTRADEGEAREVALLDLLAGEVGGDSPLGRWRLSASEAFDAALDAGRSLGTREFAGEWLDAGLAPGDHWYYARIVQTDGELAWSSPIWVTRR